MREIDFDSVRALNLEKRKIKKQLKELEKEKAMLKDFMDSHRALVSEKLEVSKLAVEASKYITDDILSKPVYKNCDKRAFFSFSTVDLIVFDSIVKIACNDSPLLEMLIFDKCRKQEVVLYRMLIRYYLVNYFNLKLSLKTIGAITGKADHSTIIHADNYIKSIGSHDKIRLNIKTKIIERMRVSELEIRNKSNV